MSSQSSCKALLGDTPERDYSQKLRLFHAFAAPEIRQTIDGLGLKAGMKVLDAGCGSGELLATLAQAVGPSGAVLGVDVSRAHVLQARKSMFANVQVEQGDVLDQPWRGSTFDLVWCMNTIHHLADPLQGIEVLKQALRPAGRIALCQSSLLPDMFFAWDEVLERKVAAAVRRYYCDRYNVDEQTLTGIRAVVGLLRESNLRDVQARTLVIERIAPVDAATHEYLVEAIFRSTWGHRLRSYLTTAELTALSCLCDPDSPQFALRRPDFHFVQTITLVVGELTTELAT